MNNLLIEAFARVQAFDKGQGKLDSVQLSWLEANIPTMDAVGLTSYGLLELAKASNRDELLKSWLAGFSCPKHAGMRADNATKTNPVRIQTVTDFDSLYGSAVFKRLGAVLDGLTSPLPLDLPVEGLPKILQEEGIYRLFDLLSSEKREERNEIIERSKYFDLLRQQLPKKVEIVRSFSDTGTVELRIDSPKFKPIYDSLQGVEGLELQPLSKDRIVLDDDFSPIGATVFGVYRKPDAP